MTPFCIPLYPMLGCSCRERGFKFAMRNQGVMIYKEHLAWSLLISGTYLTLTAIVVVLYSALTNVHSCLFDVSSRGGFPMLHRSIRDLLANPAIPLVNISSLSLYIIIRCAICADIYYITTQKSRPLKLIELSES